MRSNLKILYASFMRSKSELVKFIQLYTSKSNINVVKIRKTPSAKRFVFLLIFFKTIETALYSKISRWSEFTKSNIKKYTRTQHVYYIQYV